MQPLSSLGALNSSPQSSGYIGLGMILRRAVEERVATGSSVDERLVMVWIVLQLAGQIALPILIATMVFHKKVARRNPTIINLCIVWTVATIPPELLFYAGRYKGPPPSVMLCLLQAATVSGIAPMVAAAYFAVVIHACTVIYELNHDITVRPFTVNLRMIALLASPYIAFLAFSIYVAFVGASHPRDIFRDDFFCVVGAHNLSTPVFVFTVAVVIFTLIAQAWIIYTCYRDFRSKDSNSNRSYGSSRSLRLSNFDMQFVLRMMGFTIFEIVIVVACIASILNPELTFAKLLIATPPFAVFLVFATSQDILCAWFPCFFRKDSSALVRSRSVLQVSRSERATMRPSRDLPSALYSRNSEYSRYSQSSQKPSTVSKIDSGVPDMEKGIQRPSEAHVHLSRDFTVEAVETSMMIQTGTSQQNPLDTIRSFRSSPTQLRRKPLSF